MIVVPVFITNCHVSEKSKMGPVTIQIIITNKAIMKAYVVPENFVAFCAIFSKKSSFDLLFS